MTYLTEAIALLRRKSEESFWGTVNMKFKNGALAHITIEESLLPEQLNPKDRRFNDKNITQ
jgi:hypothetical protein